MRTNYSIINKKGVQIFYSPTRELDYESLVLNSLGSNTYRGFHKIDKNKSGAKEVFDNVFINNSQYVINTLNNAQNEIDLDSFEKELCQILKSDLKNIKNKQLISFNKLRKPVDIIVEHLVSMGDDFSSSRQKITPHLFLPLDSQMFRSKLVFSDKEISELRLKRSFTFKDIFDENQYYEIQNFLKEKAVKVGLQNRIFFDLVWNDRYESKGQNLFETNPKGSERI